MMYLSIYIIQDEYIHCHNYCLVVMFIFPISYTKTSEHYSYPSDIEMKTFFSDHFVVRNLYQEGYGLRLRGSQEGCYMELRKDVGWN